MKIAKMIGEDIADVKKQIVMPPNPLDELGVPTLHPDYYRPLTPMLRARFEYASEWRNAYAGHDWLSIQQMKDATKDGKLLDKVKSCAEMWSSSPPARFAMSQISLFGIYFDQGEETYLVWPTTDGAEPHVVSYAGNYEREFNNLKDYLSFILHEP